MTNKQSFDDSNDTEWELSPEMIKHYAELKADDEERAFYKYMYNFIGPSNLRSRSTRFYSV